jgi:uncharacterized protein YdeI (YjbR/CyaY-like superfamily)
MTTSKKNPKVDAYIKEDKTRQGEVTKLRNILLDCGLTEELKWGLPCYAFNNSNVVVIQGFKKYCALLFFKGYMMKDPDGVLIKTGPNTRVGRQLRFNNPEEVDKMKSVVKSYVEQAIEVEKSGVTVDLEKQAPAKIPEEFQNKMDKNRTLKTAFHALTPGRQRAYIFHFSQPKQSATRELRIEKYIPQILKGKGMNDDYVAMKK